jgi:protein-S-isoprenylcysteine O-methyltransferase Ste14
LGLAINLASTLTVLLVLMKGYGYALIGVGTLLWFFPFLSAHQHSTPASLVNRRARCGMVVQALSYAVLWQGRFWAGMLPGWRAALSVTLFLVAAALSWSSARALARQFRIDAALGEEDRLVRSGPYHFMRNPIYTSMLLILSATGLILASWPLFLLSLVLFALGTQVRVSSEEELLEKRFGEEFRTYKREVPAYVPRFYPAGASRLN